VIGWQYFFKGNKALETVQDPAVDIVIQGSADHIFPRVLADLEAGRDVARIPGLALRRDGRAVDTGPAAPLRSLDSVPFADFTGFPMELYEDQNRIPIAASRGCVWACRFCSTREFWPMYSYMSGERIYAEICHHRRLFPGRYHVEFYDITANGKPECLSKLSDLIIENERWTGGWKEFKWKINAIIRPEMTSELLGKMARANCQDIIYGVESGSPRVLKKMNKHYNVAIAERVLRDTHGAGIKAIGNFMFGFPGETEEDFQMTLNFLERNHASFDRVYASATFTSLEEHSYLTEHQDQFDIAPQDDKHHSLYWQTRDGSNTYLVRLDRYNRFRETAIRLGIDAYKGVNGALALDHALNTAHYYLYADKPMESLRHYLRYFQLDTDNQAVREQTRPFWKSARLMRAALGCLSKANDALSAGDREALETVEQLKSAPDAGNVRKIWWNKVRRPGENGHRPSLRWALQALYRLKKIDFYRTDLEYESPAGKWIVLWGKDRLDNPVESGKVIADFLDRLDRLESGTSMAPAEASG
jgi:anaerobic magnesium-protoporphyrin IX monomethyl ester cyclase